MSDVEQGFTATGKEQDRGIKFLSPVTDCFAAEEWYQFATADHFWMKWRFQALRKILPDDYVWGRSLDIGCGKGVVRRQLEKYYGCKVSGCDLNLAALQTASLEQGPLYYYNIHQRQKEFKENFSTILLMDVLEHIGDPVEFLRSVNFHLEKGGKLIINVPAFQFLYSKYDEVAEHVKRYTVSDIKSELSSAGFRVEDYAYWGITMIPILIVRKLLMRFCPKEQVIKSGFQPHSPLVNFVLRFLMWVENVIPFKYPIGTSLVVVARKEKSNPS